MGVEMYSPTNGSMLPTLGNAISSARSVVRALALNSGCRFTNAHACHETLYSALRRVLDGSEAYHFVTDEGDVIG